MGLEDRPMACSLRKKKKKNQHYRNMEGGKPQKTLSWKRKEALIKEHMKLCSETRDTHGGNQRTNLITEMARETLSVAYTPKVVMGNGDDDDQVIVLFFCYR